MLPVRRSAIEVAMPREYSDTSPSRSPEPGVMQYIIPEGYLPRTCPTSTIDVIVPDAGTYRRPRPSVSDTGPSQQGTTEGLSNDDIKMKMAALEAQLAVHIHLIASLTNRLDTCLNMLKTQKDSNASYSKRIEVLEEMTQRQSQESFSQDLNMQSMEDNWRRALQDHRTALLDRAQDVSAHDVKILRLEEFKTQITGKEARNTQAIEALKGRLDVQEKCSTAILGGLEEVTDTLALNADTIAHAQRDCFQLSKLYNTISPAIRYWNATSRVCVLNWIEQDDQTGEQMARDALRLLGLDSFILWAKSAKQQDGVYHIGIQLESNVKVEEVLERFKEWKDKKLEPASDSIHPELQFVPYNQSLGSLRKEYRERRCSVGGSKTFSKAHQETLGGKSVPYLRPSS